MGVATAVFFSKGMLAGVGYTSLCRAPASAFMRLVPDSFSPWGQAPGMSAVPPLPHRGGN